MCGISGIFDSRSRGTARQILKMTDTLHHRGPDDAGHVFGSARQGRLLHQGSDVCRAEEEAGHTDSILDLSLGHRRLSILDLSPDGRGPMAFQDGAYWLTYNGEVYNYVELRHELKEKGYVFCTRTDTEVVLAAYAEWGEDCLRRFNGMFAFALWDVRKRLLFCARDRFGIKPFYYYWDGRLFVFASEIKAVLQHSDVRTRTNDAVIYDYLALGLVDHSAETFFKDILQLPASHHLLLDFTDLTLRQQRWWNLRISAENSVTSASQAESATNAFRDLLMDSIRLRLRSDVRVGSCLSGGLDSSSIVAMINRQLTDPKWAGRQDEADKPSTFSACFEGAGIDESWYIAEIVNATHVTSRKTVPEAHDLWNELERLVYFQEQPFTSTSVYAQWCVMRLARDHGATVLLDGQGADEIMAGYVHYFGPFIQDTYREKGIGAMVRNARLLSRNTNRPLWQLIGLGMHKRFSPPLRRAFQKLNASLNPPGPVCSCLNRADIAPDFEAAHGKRRRLHRERQEADPTQLLALDLGKFVLPGLLRYEDRNAMAFSLEARVPFLDHRLVEFAFSLPMDLKIRNGWTKWLLRNAMGLLPDSIRWRKDKIGFATPEEQWIKHGGHLENFFRSEPLQSQGYYSEAIRKSLSDVNNPQKHSIPGIWRLVNLEAWMRVFQNLDAAPYGI